MTRQLLLGDCKPVLEELPQEMFDLAYLDPPWNKKSRFNQIWHAGDGHRETSSFSVWEDIWTYTESTIRIIESIKERHQLIYDKLDGLQKMIGKNSLFAYLIYIAERLLAIKRTMKPTGVIYFHCDPTISGYIRVILDIIFTPQNFQNCISWVYGLGGSSPKRWPRKHDDILFYSMGDEFYFEPEMTPATSQRMHGQLKKRIDVWEDIPAINNMAKERLGYPTQKPEKLLKRIISTSCPRRGHILDPFVGGGTSLVVAEELQLSWTGIDKAMSAISVSGRRIKKKFGSLEITDGGIPVDMESAEELAQKNPYDCQVWMIQDLLGGYSSGPGADRGIDGKYLFSDSASRDQEDKVIIISAKTGNINPDHIRQLEGARRKEGAIAGVLITLKEPTVGMITEAAEYGNYKSEIFETEHPRIQILSVKDVLYGGKEIDHPGRVADNTTYRKVPAFAKLESQMGFWD